MAIQRAQTDLEVAQAEVSRLEAELAQAKARAARLQGFLEMAREYGVTADEAPADMARSVVAMQPRQRMTRDAPQRHAAVVRAVLPELRRDAWKPARELVPAVRAVGITLDTDMTRAAKKLCAFLAREPSIEGSEKQGWRVRAG